MPETENIQSSEIVVLPYEELSLDLKNPRLPESLHKTETAIIDYIAQTTAIEELMSAIAENGFFPGEPLVVVEENGRKIVVEGNRRLTAVILLNKGLRKQTR